MQWFEKLKRNKALAWMLMLLGTLLFVAASAWRAQEGSSLAMVGMLLGFAAQFTGLVALMRSKR